jgi:hypothetical protein
VTTAYFLGLPDGIESAAVQTKHRLYDKRVKGDNNDNQATKQTVRTHFIGIYIAVFLEIFVSHIAN